MSEWLCVIRPARTTFMEDASPEESQVMRDHFAYLKSLLDAGKLVLAGPRSTHRSGSSPSRRRTRTRRAA
jgi:uncharacterized protein YciI